MQPVVKVTVKHFIATVVMDRPPVNARSGRLRRELIAASFERREPNFRGR